MAFVICLVFLIRFNVSGFASRTVLLDGVFELIAVSRQGFTHQFIQIVGDFLFFLQAFKHLREPIFDELVQARFVLRQDIDR